MSLIRLPGLIDIHVHLRDPGAAQKEDFYTGSRAAVKGGFTYVVDMPNNPIPTISPISLTEKIKLSDKKAICRIGFHYGTDGKNMDTFESVWNNPRIFGLKIYCNHTTGTLLIEDNAILKQIFTTWKSDKPILVHAEGERTERMIDLAKQYRKKLHICHVSNAREVDFIRKAKRKKIPITTGVTPHHLFLRQADVEKLGPFGVMRPEIGSNNDNNALWEGLLDGTIDIVESDHAPHTKAEKIGQPVPFGVPGLETTLGLMLGSVQKKRIRIDQIIVWMHYRPQKIFNIPDQKNTYIEVDPEIPYTIGQYGYETKCGWSPFDGWEGYGKVEKVVIDNKTVLVDKEIV